MLFPLPKDEVSGGINLDWEMVPDPEDLGMLTIAGAAANTFLFDELASCSTDWMDFG